MDGAALDEAESDARARRLSAMVAVGLARTCPADVVAAVMARTREQCRASLTPSRGPDVQSTAARTAFAVLSGKARAATRAAGQEAAHGGAVRVEVRTPLGVHRVRVHASAKDLAADVLSEAGALDEVCVDARSSDDGVLLFTTTAHAVTQRERGLLQCPTCAAFQRGPRGLRDHQLVVHGGSYRASVAVAENAERALVVVPSQPRADDACVEAARLRAREAAQREAAVGEAQRRAETPGLVAAAKAGDLAAVQRLCAADRGGSAKERAAALEWAAGLGALPVVRFLVATCQCDVNASSEDRDMLPENKSSASLRRTPLHWAARHGRTAVVRWLLARGAHVDARMRDGTTPFHYAVLGGHIGVCRVLAGEGCDVNARNAHGCNATQWAVLSGGDSGGGGGGAAALLGFLQEQGVLFTLVSKNGHTVLHKAAQRGNVEAATWILARPAVLGVDVAARDKDGDTAQELARANGFDDLAAVLEQP